ncbi:hypothetical protein RRG08_020473 [Elysia crispata]|uniref:Uncharacterized protein n=1 Tax=Elysia crispata TaxID=231223 RepID=A0AAE1ABC6_9GAST|nr:hypothetical protein RRG08_020473 [Elysia crispata]
MATDSARSSVSNSHTESKNADSPHMATDSARSSVSNSHTESKNADSPHPHGDRLCSLFCLQLSHGKQER